MPQAPDPHDMHAPDARPDDCDTLVLIRRAQQGDASALDALLRRSLPPLTRWARARFSGWGVDGVDVEDLVQDAVLSTLRRLHLFEPAHPAAFQAFLRTAVQNRARDLWRRARRRPVDGTELPDVPDLDTPSPLTQAIDAERRARVRRALRLLPAPQSQVVTRRVEREQSFAEIAAATGRSNADAARMAHQRAVARLRSTVTELETRATARREPRVLRRAA